MHDLISYVQYDSFISVTWLMKSRMGSRPWVPAISTTNTGNCVTRRSHMCDMTHSYVWHDAFICVTWRIHMGGMALIHVWHDSFICAIWLNHQRVITHQIVHGITAFATCYIHYEHSHMCDMTHSYVWHDSFICVAPLIYVCEVTHLCVWHDSFCVTWLIHMCDITYSCVWHDSFISDMTHS